MPRRSDAAPLRWPATVVRHRRDVLDRRNAKSTRVQRAHRRLAARARTADPHLEVLEAAFLRGTAGVFRGDLRRKRRRLARTLESLSTRAGPGQRVALAI